MKTGEELRNKEYQSPRLPRQARTSVDHRSKRSEGYEENRSANLDETRRPKHEETRSGNIEFRIQGLPHSTVQKEDCNRKEIVKILIQQFENHPNRDLLIEDLNKTEEFNPFSEKSKKLITSMGNTDYFELCEISSKIRCAECSS